MAGSRTERIGTIFSRVTGLIRAGALKSEDKPLWYDVWKAFPPKYEPNADRPPIMKPIRDIFYKEDIIRARFYKHYPNATIDMANEETPSISQKFVNKYYEIQKSGNFANEDEIFQAAATALSLPGTKPQPTVELKKPTVEAEVQHDNEKVKGNFNLSDILKKDISDDKL